MLSCDEFSENTGIQSNTEVSLRVESELNLKEEIQHWFKITPSWNMSKHNTKCMQSVPSHRLESSHDSQKMCNFQPHEPSSREENETRLQFVSVSVCYQEESPDYRSSCLCILLYREVLRLNYCDQGSALNPEHDEVQTQYMICCKSREQESWNDACSPVPHSIAAWLW